MHLLTIVLFLDCDDWLDLNCIEKAVNKFESDSNIDIVLWEIKTAYEYKKQVPDINTYIIML